MKLTRLWDISSGLLCGHAVVLIVGGQWLRGYMALALAIMVQIVRAIDARAEGGKHGS